MHSEIAHDLVPFPDQGSTWRELPGSCLKLVNSFASRLLEDPPEFLRAQLLQLLCIHNDVNHKSCVRAVCSELSGTHCPEAETAGSK